MPLKTYILLALFFMPADVDASPAADYLINTQASLMDLGALKSKLWFKKKSNLDVDVMYKQGEGKIVIFLNDDNTIGDMRAAKTKCKNILTELRSVAGVDANGQLWSKGYEGNEIEHVSLFATTFYNPEAKTKLDLAIREGVDVITDVVVTVGVLDYPPSGGAAMCRGPLRGKDIKIIY